MEELHGKSSQREREKAIGNRKGTIQVRESSNSYINHFTFVKNNVELPFQPPTNYPHSRYLNAMQTRAMFWSEWGPIWSGLQFVTLFYNIRRTVTLQNLIIYLHNLNIRHRTSLTSGISFFIIPTQVCAVYKRHSKYFWKDTQTSLLKDSYRVRASRFF